MEVIVITLPFKSINSFSFLLLCILPWEKANDGSNIGVPDNQLGDQTWTEFLAPGLAWLFWVFEKTRNGRYFSNKSICQSLSDSKKMKMILKKTNSPKEKENKQKIKTKSQYLRVRSSIFLVSVQYGLAKDVYL